MSFEFISFHSWKCFTLIIFLKFDSNLFFWITISPSHPADKLFHLFIVLLRNEYFPRGLSSYIYFKITIPSTELIRLLNFGVNPVSLIICTITARLSLTSFSRLATRNIPKNEFYPCRFNLLLCRGKKSVLDQTHILCADGR